MSTSTNVYRYDPYERPTVYASIFLDTYTHEKRSELSASLFRYAGYTQANSEDHAKFEDFSKRCKTATISLRDEFLDGTTHFLYKDDRFQKDLSKRLSSIFNDTDKEMGFQYKVIQPKNMKEIRGHMGATMLRDLDLYNNPMNRVITIKPQSRLSSLISKMTPGKNSNDDRNEIYYCQNVFNPDRHKTKAEDLKTLQRFIEGPYSDYMHNLKLDHPPMDAIGTLARDNHWNIAESNLSRSTIDQLHFLYEGHVRPREPEAEEEEEEEEE